MLNDDFTDDTQITPPPHLAGLNDKQRKFVAAFLTHGNGTQAAKDAGYGGKDEKYLSQRAYELMRNQKIRDAITGEQLASGHSLRTKALLVWEKILDDPRTDKDTMKLKLAAAKELADRFGLVRVQRTEGTVAHVHQFANMPVEEIEHFIRDKIKASKVLDGVPYTEIEAATQDIVIPSLQELRGLPAPGAEVDFQAHTKVRPAEDTIKSRVRALTCPQNEEMRTQTSDVSIPDTRDGISDEDELLAMLGEPPEGSE